MTTEELIDLLSLLIDDCEGLHKGHLMMAREHLILASEDPSHEAKYQEYLDRRAARECICGCRFDQHLKGVTCASCSCLVFAPEPAD